MDDTSRIDASLFEGGMFSEETIAALPLDLQIIVRHFRLIRRFRFGANSLGRPSDLADAENRLGTWLRPGDEATRTQFISKIKEIREKTRESIAFGRANQNDSSKPINGPFWKHPDNHFATLAHQLGQVLSDESDEIFRQLTNDETSKRLREHGIALGTERGWRAIACLTLKAQHHRLDELRSALDRFLNREISFTVLESLGNTVASLLESPLYQDMLSEVRDTCPCFNAQLDYNGGYGDRLINGLSSAKDVLECWTFLCRGYSRGQQIRELLSRGTALRDSPNREQFSELIQEYTRSTSFIIAALWAQFSSGPRWVVDTKTPFAESPKDEAGSDSKRQLPETRIDDKAPSSVNSPAEMKGIANQTKLPEPHNDLVTIEEFAKFTLFRSRQTIYRWARDAGVSIPTPAIEGDGSSPDRHARTTLIAWALKIPRAKQILEQASQVSS